MAKMVELYYVSQYFMTTGEYKRLPPLQLRPDPRIDQRFLNRD